MKKALIITAVVAVVLGVVFGPMFARVNNELYPKWEGINQKVATVQMELQAQADTLPNLVNAVRGATSHEEDTLKGVMEARAGLTAVAKMDPQKIVNDPETRKQLIEAQTKMDNAMMKMTSVSERYPQLQTIGLFKDVMREITGKQNSIKQARRQVQMLVTDYNVDRGLFPRNIVAAILRYNRIEDFKADEAAQKAPTLDFQRR